MLEIEEFKKIFDNFEVEGFELEDSSMPDVELFFIICPNHRDFRLNKEFKYPEEFNKVYYPLLLTKIIDGINKLSYFGSLKIEIKQHRWGIDIIDHNLPVPKNELAYYRYESGGAGEYKVLKAKENTIKFILEYI